MSRDTAAERQRKLDEEKARFLAKGGRIEAVAAKACQRNPAGEDRHNNFLFLGKRR